MSEPQILFDVMLHIGTLAAIAAVFGKDINGLLRTAFRMISMRALDDEPGGRMLIAIAAGCVPTAVIGVLFAEQFEHLFSSMTAAGVGLLITGFILMSTAWKKKQTQDAQENAHQTALPVGENCVGARRAVPACEESSQLTQHVSVLQALIIGTAQGIAIAPGVSRSGATIAVALLLGVPRELAARFSFLLAIPAILGALAFEVKDTIGGAPIDSQSPGIAATVSGTIIAAITGIIALLLLLRIVKNGRISLFAYYCWALGILAIALDIMRV